MQAATGLVTEEVRVAAEDGKRPNRVAPACRPAGAIHAQPRVRASANGHVVQQCFGGCRRGIVVLYQAGPAYPVVTALDLVVGCAG
eukprot:590007-Prymnesium_polylepis.1